MRSSSTKQLNFWEREEIDIQKRKKHFEESKLNTSQASPVQKNEQGQVKSGPVSFLVSLPKKGKGTDVYFSPTIFQNGDLYVDSSKGKHLTEHLNAQKAIKIHDTSFKPTGSISYRSSNFEFMPTQPIHEKVIKKDENGSTIIGPKNILGFAPKKGTSMSPGITIGKYPEYISDEYDYGRKLQQQQLKYHHLKMQDQPFKPASLHGSFFTNNKQSYGGEFPEKKLYQLQAPKIAQHDRPFYPSNPPKKSVYDKTINKFPEHMPDPIYQATRKQSNEDGNGNGWKRSYRGMSSPASPIVMNNLNLRKEFPSLRKLKV